MIELEQLTYPVPDFVQISLLAKSINEIGRDWNIWLKGISSTNLFERLGDYKFVCFTVANEKVIGFATLTQSSSIRNSSEIASIYVIPAYRGNGIAPALVSKLYEASGDLGYEVITALVNPSQKFIKVLDKLGFAASTIGRSLIMGKRIQ